MHLMFKFWSEGDGAYNTKWENGSSEKKNNGKQTYN